MAHDPSEPSAARQLAERLRTWRTSGDGPGLRRLSDALGRLANEQPRFRRWLHGLDAVKITGSNGKGATATLLAALFTELGVRTGLYTSPHLRRPSERVRVDGRQVDDAELLEAWRATRALAGEDSGAFERMTLAALKVFADFGNLDETGPFETDPVEAVVAEAGIGGRLDPTRVIPGQLAAITSLDLEHTRLLGPTLETIACDKADICPHGGTLVLGADIDGALLESLRRHTDPRGLELIALSERVRRTDPVFDFSTFDSSALDPSALDPSAFDPSAPDRRGPVMRFDLEFRRLEGAAPARLDRLDALNPVEKVEMAMVGEHQCSNAVVALLLAEAWLARHRPAIDSADLIGAWRRVLARTTLPGRFERVARGPDLFIDHCHTPKAAAVVAETARALPGGLLLVLGVSGDKDVAAVAGPLLAVAEVAVLTRAHHRGGDPARLQQLVRRDFPALEHRRIDSLGPALAEARRLARERGLTVLVAGGLFLGVEAVEVLEGRDPQQLRFL